MRAHCTLSQKLENRLMLHSAADLLYLMADRTVEINLVYLSSNVTDSIISNRVSMLTEDWCCHLSPLQVSASNFCFFFYELIGRPIISSNKLWRVSASHLPHSTSSFNIPKRILAWTQSWLAYCLFCAFSRWCMLEKTEIVKSLSPAEAIKSSILYIQGDKFWISKHIHE